MSRMNQPIATPSRTLLGFGASTMQGVGDTSAGGFFTRASRAESMQRRYANFINHGIGGNTVADMLARVDKAVDAAGLDYDVVVILGCNDVPRDRDGNPAVRSTPQAYAATLAQMFPRVKSPKGRSLFISSFAVSYEKTGVCTDVFSQYMDPAMKLAQQAGYEVWDLWRATEPVAPRYWATDGLHFNDAGHQYIADGVVARFATA